MIEVVLAFELNVGDKIILGARSFTYEILSVKRLRNDRTEISLCLDGDSTRQPIVMMKFPPPTVLNRVIPKSA